MNSAARIAVTAGEPAGIGPDIVLELANHDWPVELVVFGSRSVLEARANQLHNVQLRDYRPEQNPEPSKAGQLTISDINYPAPVVAGKLNQDNAVAVVDSLRRACEGCLSGEFAGMVTAPVQKSIINDAGIAFSGHTEFLAELCGDELPVMMLASESLRVALVTTHLPLRAVPDAITAERLQNITRTVSRDLENRFGINNPAIAVLGLNPHAGEDGHLGHEETEVIIPALNELRSEGLNITGPLPADTAFTQQSLKGFDGVIAMFHDQGLPVVKHAGFGEVVNITLGLPIVRTSVDHGTALDLAGSGRANPRSLLEATRVAISMAGGATE